MAGVLRAAVARAAPGLRHVRLVRFGNGINKVLDSMLQIEDQFVVSSQSVKRIAVTEVVKYLEDSLRTLHAE